MCYFDQMKCRQSWVQYPELNYNRSTVVGRFEHPATLFTDMLLLLSVTFAIYVFSFPSPFPRVSEVCLQRRSEDICVENWRKPRE